MNPTLYHIFILNSFKKFQIYTPYFLFEKHLNNYWNSWKQTSDNFVYNYIQMNPTKTTILNTFIKSDILTLPLTPTWKPNKNVQKSKIECNLSNHHMIYYISSIYFLHKKNCTLRDMDPFVHQRVSWLTFNVSVIAVVKHT